MEDRSHRPRGAPSDSCRADRAPVPLSIGRAAHAASSSTIRGQWMCPREANVGMIRLVRSGLIDLSHFEVTEFGLDDANAAVDHAAAHGGPFRMTVLRP